MASALVVAAGWFTAVTLVSLVSPRKCLVRCGTPDECPPKSLFPSTVGRVLGRESGRRLLARLSGKITVAL